MTPATPSTRQRAAASNGRCTLAPSRLTLRALAYRRTRPPSHAGTELGANARELAALAVEEASRCAMPAASIDEHVISSTVLSPLLLDGRALSEAFVAAVSAGLGRGLDWLTCPYECAGWGFVMRDQCLRTDASRRARRLLLQVVDVDIHRFGVWRHNPKWGASGFGIGTLLLDIAPAARSAPAPGAGLGDAGRSGTHAADLPGSRPPAPSPTCAAVEVGAAAPAFALPQWACALRNFCQSRPGLPVALPFFPEGQRQALLRALEAGVAPDGHRRFGHCFGSDPWISWLLWLADPARPAPRRIVVSSLALNGYHATADVQLAPGAAWRLQDDT